MNNVIKADGIQRKSYQFSSFAEIFNKNENVLDFMKEDLKELTPSLNNKQQIDVTSKNNNLSFNSTYSKKSQRKSNQFRTNGHKYYKINTSVNAKVQEEQEVKDDLESSREDIAIDRRHKTYVGDEAPREYYKHFRQLNKVVEQNKKDKIKDSAFTKMLMKTEEKQVLPCKLGIIKRMGDKDCIDLSNQRFGDNYCSILGEGVSHIPQLKVFKLKNNRISEKSASSVLSAITQNGTIIDLSGNKIGKLGCQLLAKSLSSHSWLEELSLVDNGLGDKAAGLLLSALLTNTVLRKLNLSKNYLTDVLAQPLRELLVNSKELKELYLHWNYLKAESGIQLFTGLASNNTLKVLDVSWNKLGNQSNTCIQSICTILKNNNSLLHLDLSNNNINKDGSKQIADALVDNHTLYGLHFQGNHGYVDSCGFIQIIDIACHTKTDRQIDGVCVMYNKQRIGEQIDQCWLCGGWQEVDVGYGVGQVRPVYLHMDYDRY